MRIEVKTTITSDELNLVNKIIGWIAPDESEIQFFDNEIKITCLGGTWPDDLDHRVRNLQKWHHVEVDLVVVDLFDDPSFKRISIRKLKSNEVFR